MEGWWAIRLMGGGVRKPETTIERLFFAANLETTRLPQKVPVMEMRFKRGQRMRQE
jgi:hypothetical protein